MGRLTTHVLDTAAGKPAAGLHIELWCLDGEPVRLTALSTNADGRADAPLLEGADFRVGTYELRFFAGDYLRKTQELPETAFLDMIPIRFGVSDSGQHYHVPLLLSAYGYSTYRGS
ncbi:5-hydroxyisourate hydrolase [Breoghania corrubedonensis]|uniref:5-hydroxyisourate hydrolase n=1 Tax=Breoghania corrubedonensis TaxID=665038 RepID=A0A2T5V8N6_9HYPH|nr:hydroxyisourate hydrolase [Breoghania corrubedonensis]PTW60129.1 5-hydroxyisourate hydrolase [Breoghania corrubedonensis]